MFTKFIFDPTPHNTVRMWAYFDEKDFHLVLNSPARVAFDFMSCVNNYDKRETGMLSWEFPESLTEYFYEKYKLDSRADVGYLRRALSKQD